MKTIYLALFTLSLLFSTNYGNAQTSTFVFKVKGIKKYHSLTELESMSKGELIPIYQERVDILFNIIPYLGVTDKNAVTFKDLGIPETKENKKTLDSEKENSKAYLAQNNGFLVAILPYSDTKNIINAILFYEEVMKLIKTNLQE
jgi:hypothetical protein